jgi:hypothetical protein
MMNRTRRHSALIVCALVGTGLLAGAAAAGNPNGTAPGQAKQTQSTSSGNGKSTAPGQAKKASNTSKSDKTKTSSGKAHQANSSSSNSSVGVKPSSTTQHNTHAAAGSNQTKLYGNGKTAGQIAQENGASPTTDLYGPGNSQPHKVAVCSKNGKTHYVDVHALKAHSSSSCTSGSTESSDQTQATDATKVKDETQVVVIEGMSQKASKSLIEFVLQSGVLGASNTTVQGAVKSATRGTVKSTTKQSSGVLGTRHTLSKRVAGTTKSARAVVRAASFTG